MNNQLLQQLIKNNMNINIKNIKIIYQNNILTLIINKNYYDITNKHFSANLKNMLYDNLFDVKKIFIIYE